MIRLTFIAGGGIRKVFIDDRIINFLTAETSFVPLVVDLDNLDKLNSKIKKTLGKEAKKTLQEISLLETEEDIANDIIKDFQKTGWRKIKKENGLS